MDVNDDNIVGGDGMVRHVELDILNQMDEFSSNRNS